jgi:membrane fusion protein (multidrug efflux system)
MSEGSGTDLPVKLVMANGQLFDQPGKIDTVLADFNNETGTIALRASFPNPNRLLRHGQTGKVVMSTTLDDAVVIPQKATFDVLEKKFVYVVNEKGEVHSKSITVLAELPNVFVVASGVDERDQILVEGLRKVHEGSEIEPHFQKPGDVLAHLDVPAE